MSASSRYSLHPASHSDTNNSCLTGYAYQNLANKSHPRNNREYCWPIWPGVTISSLFSLDKILKRFCRALHMINYFPPNEVSPLRRNVTSLSLRYRYLHRKCSDGLHCVDPPILTFTLCPCTGGNDPHFLQILLVRRKFLLGSWFARAAALWNRLPKECFPDQYIYNNILHK